MKAEIIGYVTGMVNSYIRTIDQYKKDEIPKEKYKKFDLVKEELSDLLDYIQDIPEEINNAAIKIDNLSLNYVKKLEKINYDLRLENISWQKKSKAFEENNKFLTETITRMSVNLQNKETN